MTTMRVGSVCALACLLAVAPASLAGKKAPEPPAVATIDDPCIDGTEAQCRRRALDGFRAALAATEGGTATRAIRIAILGDSLIADDTIADRLRQRLGKRFGTAGPGFVPVVPPPGGKRHFAVKRTTRTSSWKVHRVTQPLARDRLLGYAGASNESRGHATARLVPTDKDLSTVELHYLAQPGGGDLDVLVDGKKLQTIDTSGKAKKAGYATVTAKGGIGKLELRASGKVRLFGVALEAERGVVVDNLGIKNATAMAWTKNQKDHWQGQIAHRAPDLFIVMIGSNEAGWLSGKPLAGYQKVIEALLAPIRAGNPDGSCLVIAPLDQVAGRIKKLPQRKSIVPMVEAQRRAAAAAGCAFWDAYAWMGGARSSLAWYRSGWMTRDFAHPTTGGDRRIADALAAGLIAAYEPAR
jgi:lysophospholipase L1-like esterase